MVTKTATKTAAKSKARTRTTAKRPDSFKEAKRCIDTIKESWFDFSVIVAEIYESDAYEKKGYESFADCAKAEWGLEYRSAMNRVNAGLAIKEHGITKKMAKDTGWTNFMEVTSLFEPGMKKREIEGYIKKAGKMTHDEIQRFKQEVRHKRVGGEVQRRVKMIFQFLNEQADAVQAILDRGREQFGLTDDDIVLEYILTDWDTLVSDKGKIKPSIMKKLKGKPSDAEEEEEAPKPKRKKRADTKKKKATEEEEPDDDEGEDLLDDETGEDSEVDEEDFDFEDED